MISSLRSAALCRSSSNPSSSPLRRLLGFIPLPAPASQGLGNHRLLELGEVEKVLCDVKADDVRVVPVGDQCGWTDYMVLATGRSAWHVRNIAQALIHKIKQKQKGADRVLLPSIEGHEGGKWIVIDSGTVIIHALDEKARAYYNLESLWATEMTSKGVDHDQDLEKAIVKTRRKNNSKKPASA